MLGTILLPLDGSALADRALPYATELARRAGSRLVLVRAVQALTFPGIDPSDAQLQATTAAEQALDATVTRLRAEGLTAEGHVYYDDPVHAILDAAQRHHAGLIVMSTHGRTGLGRMLYGSVADNVLRHADQPVLLVPAAVDHAWPAERALAVLVPLDGSALAEEALGSAELLAETFGARLHLLRVIQPPTYPLYGDGYVYVPFNEDAELTDARQYLRDLMERLRAAGKEVTTQVVIGRPDAIVPAMAAEQGTDVIAMATHGRGGLARLVMGSVATGTLQRAHLPLLLTRPQALDQALPMPAPAPTATREDDTEVTLLVTRTELGLLRQAVESLRLDARREEHIAARLGRLRERLVAAQEEAVPRETATANGAR